MASMNDILESVAKLSVDLRFRLTAVYRDNVLDRASELSTTDKARLSACPINKPVLFDGIMTTTIQSELRKRERSASTHDLEHVTKRQKTSVPYNHAQFHASYPSRRRGTIPWSYQGSHSLFDKVLRRTYRKVIHDLLNFHPFLVQGGRFIP